MSKMQPTKDKKKKSFTTHRIVMAGMLGAICVVLGVTGLGMIPIPNLTGRATILHVPVIIAGILEGPLVGGLTGLIFGIYSFLTPTGAIPADPVVRILPRVLLGIVAAYSYKLCGRHHQLGAAIAGILGSATNTVGFVGLAVVMGYLPAATFIVVAPQALVELALATVLTVMLVRVIGRAQPY